MTFFSVTFIPVTSLELLHFILFFCYAFCPFSFLALCFCNFSPSTKHNFFISFPINLKGEIYFCRNFPSKAFESPSLDVTPPPHILPLSFSSSPWTTFSSPFSFTAVYREHLTYWNIVLN